MTRLSTPSNADPDVAGPRDRFRVARRITGYAAIAGTAPYLTLKFAWLTGSDLGVTDPAFLRDASIYWLNLFTAGMDVCAVALALAFAHAWGQRVPAPLVLFPLWVGTGFLAPIVAGIPVVGAVLAVAPPPESSGEPALPLAPWVQPLVYVGFGWQGVFLLTAFLLYAMVRWPDVFRARLGELRTAVDAWTAFGYAGAALALVTAAVHLTRAFGSGLGMTAAQAAAQTPTSYAVEGIHGVAALVGAAGVLMLLRRTPPRWRLRAPVVLGWTGAGAMFSWGFWGLLNTVAATLLAGETTAVQLSATAAQTLGGILLAAAVLGRSQPDPRSYHGARTRR